MSAFDKTYYNAWPVYFKQAAGDFVSFDVSNVREDPNPEEACKLLQPLPAVDSEGNERRILIGAPPAKKLYLQEITVSTPKDAILQTPLVKVAKTDDCTISGLRSGGRSAIIHSHDDGDTYYRLKGCGNYVDQEGFRFDYPGFPLRPMDVFGEILGEEIRGCAPIHFSVRELFMTNLIEEKLKHHNEKFKSTLIKELQVGNQALGFWQYNMFHNCLRHQPDFQKTCTIFRTLGERRLNAHLLYGLEKLFRVGLVEFNVDAAKQRLHNRNGPNKPYPIATYSACGFGISPAEPCNFMNTNDLNLRLNESLLKSDSMGGSFLLDDELQRYWNEAREKIIEANQNSRVCLVTWLFWRLGHEIGEFMRFLDTEGIMWGYYYDYHPCFPHCNAHTNNYIVLPYDFNKAEDDDRAARFLAPVDFDMAYTKEAFVHLQSGLCDTEMFDNWKESEFYEMKRSVGGEVVNTGIDIEQDDHITSERTFDSLFTPINHDDFDVLNNVFRDTMLSSLHTAFNTEHDAWADYKQVEAGLHGLVRLALLLAKDIQS